MSIPIGPRSNCILFPAFGAEPTAPRLLRSDQTRSDQTRGQRRYAARVNAAYVMASPKYVCGTASMHMQMVRARCWSYSVLRGHAKKKRRACESRLPGKGGARGSRTRLVGSRKLREACPRSHETVSYKKNHEENRVARVLTPGSVDMHSKSAQLRCRPRRSLSPQRNSMQSPDHRRSGLAARERSSFAARPNGSYPCACAAVP
jgi:hypothetical protein